MVSWIPLWRMSMIQVIHVQKIYIVLIVFTCYDFRFCSKISMPSNLCNKHFGGENMFRLRENSYSQWCETEIWKTWDRCWCAGHFFLSQAAWSRGSQRDFAMIFGWDLIVEITRDCNPVVVLAGKPLFLSFWRVLYCLVQQAAVLQSLVYIYI